MLYSYPEKILIWAIFAIAIILFIKKSLLWLAIPIIIFTIILKINAIKITCLKGLIWITQKEIQAQENFKKKALKRKDWLEEKITKLKNNQQHRLASNSFISKDQHER